MDIPDLDKEELQDALAESEKKFRLAFDSSAVGKSLSFASGPFFRVNPKMCEILGYSSDEIIGKRAIDFTHPDDLELSKHNVRALMAGKKAEEMIIHSEKMMSIGGLAAGMAHEINNPLAGILQNLQVVINRLTKDIPVNEEAARKAGTDFAAIKAFMEDRKIVKQLESAYDAGTRATAIVRNMLSFVHKSTSRKLPCNLLDILDKTLELAYSDYNLKKEYDFKKIKISKRYGADIPKALCEESKIQQVILNILKNAAQALYDNPEALPERPELVFTLTSEPGYVVLSIADNGPGMDAQTQKRIFEPFFTTKPPGQGTGLGLSVSYFIIVEDHNGKMTVDSAPGQGTIFTIKLPCG